MEYKGDFEVEEIIDIDFEEEDSIWKSFVDENIDSSQIIEDIMNKPSSFDSSLVNDIDFETRWGSWSEYREIYVKYNYMQPTEEELSNAEFLTFHGPDVFYTITDVIPNYIIKVKIFRLKLRKIHWKLLIKLNKSILKKRSIFIIISCI